MKKCINEMGPVRIGRSILLFVIFVILISSSGCKKKVDFTIVGNWRIHAISPDGTTVKDYFLSFQGNESTGDVYEGSVIMGDYITYDETLFIKNIAFGYRYYVDASLGYFHTGFMGSVVDADKMTGSFSSFFTDRPQDRITGTWTGTRL